MACFRYVNDLVVQADEGEEGYCRCGLERLDKKVARFYSWIQHFMPESFRFLVGGLCKEANDECEFSRGVIEED